MKRNWQLILLMATIAVYPITVRKDADILTVTVATVLYKHLTTQMQLSQYNILKLYNNVL
jgi:hemoglobin-like flavoprotein